MATEQQLLQDFKSRLKVHFPDMQEIDLKVTESFLAINFMNFTLSIEKSRFNSFEILMNHAISIIETANRHVKNKFEKEHEKKYNEFKLSCIREQENATQSAVVRSRADFFNKSDKANSSKYTGTVVAIKKERETPESLLNILQGEEFQAQNFKVNPVLVENYSIEEGANFKNSGLAAEVVCKETVETAKNPTIRQEDLLEKRSFKRDFFINGALSIIQDGLVGIKDVDKVLKKAQKRGLFRNKNIVFDDIALSYINSSDKACKIDFNISSSSFMSVSNSIDQSFNLLKSESTSVPKRSGQDSSASSISAEQNICPKHSFVRTLISNQPQKRTIEEIMDGNLLESSFSQFEKEKFPKILFPDQDYKKANLKESPVKPPILEELNTSGFDLSINNSLITEPVILKETQNPLSCNIESKETGCLQKDSGHFKEIVFLCKDMEFGYTEIMRRFCMHYQIYFPEFEIVRENDVFRCTATFLDINFVSSYEYDKRDAKNGACKKIIEYISRNWTTIFQKSSF